MTILPYTPIPGHHRAFSVTPADQFNLAEFLKRWRQEHTADDLVPKHAPHAYGDDYDLTERTAPIGT